MTKRASVVRIILGLCFLSAFIWFFIPILYGVLNIGTWFGLGVSGTGVFICAVFPWLQKKYQNARKKKRAKTVVAVLAGLVILGFAWAAVLTCLMAFGIRTVPPESATVVVLGSQVKGEVPSADLMARIDAAEKYLRCVPEAKCIASGGQGAGEEIPEALAIQRELVARGIDPGRIYLEDRSENTEENIRFSMEIIQKEGLNPEIAIVTDEYHQYRANTIAGRQGVTSYAVCGTTPWYIFSSCYARELLAITQLLLLPES